MADLKKLDEQLRYIIGFFNEQGFDYALAGAFALHFYGYSRATADIDIVTRLEYQSLIVRKMESSGFKTLYRSDGFSNHTLDGTSVRYDFIYVDGSTAEQLFLETNEVEFHRNCRLRLLSPEHLVAMKLFAIKNAPDRALRDLSDIQELLRHRRIDSGTLARLRKEYEIPDPLWRLIGHETENDDA